VADEAVLDKLKERFSEDPLARELGIEIVEVGPGKARVRMKLDPKHRNFLGFVHGGAIFTLLDQAFALASNSHNESAVAIDMSVNFINAPSPEGELVAEATEISLGRKLGLYELVVRDGDGGLVCRSEGRVYRIGKALV